MEAFKIKKHYNYPSSKLTSFKQSGSIQKLYIIESIDDLENLKTLKENFHILGNGSNSLIHTNAEKTLFLKISPSFMPFSIHETKITVGAGVLVNQLLKYSQENKVSGFEFMAGVPASIGGTVAMNFGCWNKEVSDMLESVEVFCLDKGKFILSKKDCKLSYRSSIFQENPSWIILNATFNVDILSDSLPIKTKIQNYVKQRVEKQPIRSNTFGSIFKNPKPYSAAKLIEDAGLKGYQLKNIAISSRHANFMENINNGSAENTIEMLDFIEKKVYNLFKIKLKPEVVIFND